MISSRDIASRYPPFATAEMIETVSAGGHSARPSRERERDLVYRPF